MEGRHRYGGGDEELFLRRPSDTSGKDTVEPLRINKIDLQSSSPPSSLLQQAGHLPSSSSSGLSPQSYQYPHPKPQSPPTGGLPYPVDPRERLGSPHGYQTSIPGLGQSSAGQSSSSHNYPYPRLEGRTGSAPYPTGPATSKPLPESPGPETPDKEGLFQKMPQRLVLPHQEPLSNTRTEDDEPFTATTEFAHDFYPTPAASNSSRNDNLRPHDSSGINRLASTTSIRTTRAARGSPPPPETPAVEMPIGGGIEARYAAAGIAGPSTLSSLQAQRLQAAHTQYPVPGQQQQQQQTPPRRPWTPTEDANEVNRPSVTYYGNDEAPDSSITPTAPPSTASTQGSASRPPRQSALEHDMHNMHISEEPPPAYSSVSQGNHGYPAEKQSAAQSRPETRKPDPVIAADPDSQSHPAFANSQSPQPDPSRLAAGSPAPSHATSNTATPGPGTSASPAPSRTSPPPLPEGWIAHLDPSSGQYYYIHLPTQSTQWEFPKGPTPLNMNDVPLSPTGTFVNPLASPTISAFGGKAGLTSPTFGPQSAHYPESVLSMSTISSPTAAGFSQLPPVAGVDQFRVAPTNGVYFGPYLRYTNMDVDNGVWYGSVMLVTDAQHPPTIHIHQSVDLSPNPRQLKANHIYQHQRWAFYRYDMDLKMEEDHDAKWTYAITSHLGCTRYEFLVAGRYETSWRFIAHSGNDFGLNVNANERTRLGGYGYMWKDIVQRHQEVGGFHAQLGMGNQICADRIWKEIPLLRQWTAISGKDNRKNVIWTSQHETDVTHAYFHYYTSHLDQSHLREAFAQIPHILTLDDHDIFDGYGSYPEYMQQSNIFKNIGRIAIDMYLLFQHHTTHEILRNVHNDMDMFTITGTGWHFIKYLGPAIVVVGPDCRSERTQKAVMAGPTYQGLFPKVSILPPSVQQCIWMIPVPLVYPRLDGAEQFAQTFATGKKAVTGTFNALGKVTSSVAGIVGAKGVVGEGFNSIKKAVGKSGLMSGVLSPFGDVDLLDELRDQWTHESKDLERTYLIRTLQGIAQNKSLRMTFLSGASNCCGAGYVHDPSRPSDHKTMYQIISSSVVNAPPASYVMKLLHPSSRPLYVPANGTRSSNSANVQPTDTKEDMLEIFSQDVNGQPREMKRLMGRRNYVAFVSYDPDVIQGAFGKGMGKEVQGRGSVSLAVDFMVQNDGAGVGMGGPSGPMGPSGVMAGLGSGAAGTVKYGPIIIPSVEYGQ